MRTNGTPERGQAYTLEGFVSAMIVLMALLFALQSVVITPTTGGLADRTVQAQMEQEAQDALVISANESEGNLSELVRYWNDDDGTFHNPSDDSGRGYYNASNESEFHDFSLGEILYHRFGERGNNYNVKLVYQDGDGEFDEENATYLVDQSEGEAVTASYIVTLFESDNLTAPDGESTRLREAHNCGGGSEECYPIPPAHSDENASAIYNVVEVRVEVW